jgi:hypothetical protein
MCKSNAIKDKQLIRNLGVYITIRKRILSLSSFIAAMTIILVINAMKSKRTT